MGAYSGGGGGTAGAVSSVAGRTGAVVLTAADIGVLRAFTAAQFDKTNSSTLSDVTGLSVTLVAATSYRVSVILPVTVGVGSSGYKVGLSGTATATYAYFSGISFSGVGVSAQGSIAFVNGTLLNDTFATAADAFIIIEGYVLVDAGGTFKIQFSQSTAAPATTSSVLRGAMLVSTPLA